MKQLFFSIFVALCVPSYVSAIVVGSNAVPSRQGLFVFPTGDTDNEIRGFTTFESGFTLEDDATTCLYNAFFPIGGSVTLNGGVFTLAKHLKLASSAQFVNGGTIIGFSRVLELPNKLAIMDIPGSIVFDSVTLVCRSDVALQGLATFKGTCIIEGHGHILDLHEGSFAVGNGASVIIKDMVINGLSDGQLYCTDSLGTVSLTDVIIQQDGHYSFTQGSFDIVGECVITGTQIFSYESDQISTIGSHGILSFDSGMTFSYAPSIASNNLILMTKETSVLHLYETALHVTTTGLGLTKGTLIIEGHCDLVSDATIASEGVSIGDGLSASNDITLKILPESKLNVLSGFFNYKNVS